MCGENNTTSGENNTTSGENNTTSGENNTTSGENNTTSGENNTTSGENNTTSGENNTTSGENDTTSDENDTTSGENNTTTNTMTSGPSIGLNSTILYIQKSLYTMVDPNITSVISDDGQFITAYNISEAAFKRLTFVTNSPVYVGPPMNIVSILVYLGNNKEPTNIFGLADFVNHRTMKSGSDAFIAGKNIHQPFINGWKKRLPIGGLIDHLSRVTAQIPDTYGIGKRFTLVMGQSS